ncbi:MAG: sugar kinase [Hyphomicrobiales bacterium]|nr:sugar kinase [Hyphomicrobiales bacterium]
MNDPASASAATFDILGFGEPLFEFNRPPGQTLWQEGIGGDVSNALVAAQRCGARCTMFTALGSDVFGRAIMALWTREGIDTERVRWRDDAPTGIYFITHGEGGHEFTYRRTGSAASQVTAADLPAASIGAARVLHVSGISQAISANALDAVLGAMAQARAAGRLVSYDPNLRLKLWPLAAARDALRLSLALCDIALPGLDDMRTLTGLDDPHDIVAHCLDQGAGIVALTLGRDGALVATQEASQIIPAFKVAAVDATGAGDTFDGAFLAEYLRSNDAFRAGAFANAAAALSTQGFGAVAPMPDWAAVKAFLGEAGT